LLSAPQRERTVGDLDDEVVQVFTGDSLEEAMAHAVATLGPDLTVRRARKVRKGLQGLAGKDRYEVVALTPHADEGDALEGAFSALLQQAEQEEAGRGPRPARTATPEPPLAAAAQPAPRVLRAASAAPAAVPAPRAAVEAAAPPAPEPRPAARPARRAPRRQPAARTRAAAPAPVPVPQGWSRAALRAAGLPRAVLAALPARDPRSDAAWIAALAKAIASVLPPVATPGREHPVAVDGCGLAGVAGIVRAALKGFPPGTITYDGRTAPATPTELALAVRAELVR